MGSLTTHVLDTMRGIPAAGMALRLRSLDGSDPVDRSFVTNADGRCDGPLISGTEVTAGRYQLDFHVGDYFQGVDGVAQPPFLDIVPVRFRMDPDGGHYHVPLLVSPWSYSTYRGS